MRGRENFEDRKLVGLGGNGRACADCHMPSENFQLSPAAARARFDAMKTSGQDDPLFRPVNADDFRRHGKAADDFANTRDNGLIRITLSLPRNMRLLDCGSADPCPLTAQPTSEEVADVWRSVPSLLNVRITGPDVAPPVWPRVPNPRGGYQLDARLDTLQTQALNALRDHAEISVDPPTRWLDDVSAFESALFSSPAVAVLSNAMASGTTPLPDPDPILTSLEQTGKDVFMRSCSSCHGSPLHPSQSVPTSPPLGQRYHPNLSQCPRPTERWCTDLGCHQFAPCDQRLARNVRTYELTLPDGAKERITTSDPGRMLLSGNVSDADSAFHTSGVFDIPQLRGISRTAPYFHNNSAATLEDVLKHYQALLARRKVLAPASAFINPPFGPFTDAEFPALLAYLKKI